MRDPIQSGPRKDLNGQPKVRVQVSLGRLQGLAQKIERRRRKGGRDGEAESGVPVDPRTPNTLSGGAAAALDFD